MIIRTFSCYRITKGVCSLTCCAFKLNMWISTSWRPRTALFDCHTRNAIRVKIFERATVSLSRLPTLSFRILLQLASFWRSTGFKNLINAFCTIKSGQYFATPPHLQTLTHQLPPWIRLCNGSDHRRHIGKPIARYAYL